MKYMSPPTINDFLPDPGKGYLPKTCKDPVFCTRRTNSDLSIRLSSETTPNQSTVYSNDQIQLIAKNKTAKFEIAIENG